MAREGLPTLLAADARGRGVVTMSLYRTDRKAPHRLLLEFAVGQEELDDGKLILMLYTPLLEEMRSVLGLKGVRGKGKKLRRTKKSRVVSE